LNIDWQIAPELLQLSAKDTKQPKLEDTYDLFKYDENYYV